MALFRRQNVNSDIEAPETLSISYDRLRLILVNYSNTVERAGSWTTYAGISIPLWLSLVVSDFTANSTTVGLSGEQWQLVFVLAAGSTSARALYGLFIYLRRPRFDSLIASIISSADIVREFRAICVAKVRAQDHDYRILVYRDPLWDCFMLPHYNMIDSTFHDIDDPVLCNYFAGFVGVPADLVRSNCVSGVELKSRKHSEFHRQGTLYKFCFYIMSINTDGGGVVPDHIKNRKFTHNGKEFSWMTLSEMEADQNTRHRNLDMTRHLSDHSNLMLSLPPDSLPSRIFTF